MFKLRTLDVWDTLLRRDCHPECVKVVVAHHVFLQHFEQLAAGYSDHWGIYRARLAVERDLAEKSILAGGDGEYGVYDVVRQWLDTITQGSVGATGVARIVEYEFLTEVACTAVDEDVQEVLAAYPAERSIFLSDFYWPSDMLLRLLSRKGLESVVSEGVCSCDVGFNKRNGRLFRHVLQTFGVEPTAVIHIGDNQYSDVSAAQAHGIHAVHFKPPVAHERRLKREALFSQPEALFAEAAHKTRLACEAQVLTRNATQAAAFVAGAEMAPLYLGFCLFIAERAVLDKIARLFFLTREGEFLYRVFEAVHVHKEYRGHALPPATLLAVSRASTFSAAVNNPISDILEGGRWPHRGHPLNALVDAIGIEGSDVQQALDEAQLCLDDIIADAPHDERVRTFLNHPDVKRVADRACMTRRLLLTEYLRSEGFQENGRYAMVDLGWRGTIQSSVGHLQPGATLHGYYLALHKPSTQIPSNCKMAAYLVDENHSSRHADLFDTYALMEMLCTSGFGSTTGYEMKGSTIAPVRSATNEECPVFSAIIEEFQQGAVFGSRIWSPLVERYGCSAKDLAPEALRAWRKLADNPAEVIIEAFRVTTLDDPCARKRFLAPKDVPGLWVLVSAVWDRKAWSDVRDYLRRVRWRKAIRASASVIPANYRIVHALLILTSWYRRIKARVRGIKGFRNTFDTESGGA